MAMEGKVMTTILIIISPFALVLVIYVAGFSTRIKDMIELWKLNREMKEIDADDRLFDILEEEREKEESRSLCESVFSSSQAIGLGALGQVSSSLIGAAQIQSALSQQTDAEMQRKAVEHAKVRDHKERIKELDLLLQKQEQMLMKMKNKPLTTDQLKNMKKNIKTDQDREEYLKLRWGE